MGKCFSSTHPSTEYGALRENVLEEMCTFVSSVKNPWFGQKRELRIYTSFETSSGFGCVLHGRIFPARWTAPGFHHCKTSWSICSTMHCSIFPVCWTASGFHFCQTSWRVVHCSMYPVCWTAIQILSLPPNVLKHMSTSSLPCQNVHVLETKSNIDIQSQSHTQGSTGCILTYVLTDFMKLIVDKDLKITSVATITANHRSEGTSQDQHRHKRKCQHRNIWFMHKKKSCMYIIWAGIVRSLLAAQKTHPSSAPIKGR